MDDLTWKAKLEARSSRQKREYFLAFCIVFLLLGSICWYVFIYMRSPDYALHAIHEAVEHKDTAAFTHYVNLDEFTSRAYDDMAAALFKDDTKLTGDDKITYERFYRAIKPQMANGMGQMILNYISTGEWKYPDGEDILKGHQLGIDFERFIVLSQLTNTGFVKFGNITQRKDYATAEIIIMDKATQNQFTLEVTMRPAEDGHWQLVSMSNYRQYLTGIMALHNKDIASYLEATKNITNEYNQLAATQHSKFNYLAAADENGTLSAARQAAIKELVAEEIIPAIEKRQEKLDAIDCPPGAKYLASLRKKSDDLTIAAWKHYLNGLAAENQKELDLAATLHKRELEIEQRITDIIQHSAISRNIPNIP